MFFLPISRYEFLKFMPKGGTVAEIGVAEGEFSKCILNDTKPETLHLIDPWEFQNRQDYIDDDNNVDEEEQERRFKQVSSMFTMEAMKGQVKIHRTYSSEAANSFEGGSLNWVYLDGMHTYEGVLEDLMTYESKLTETGFFLCDDFTNNAAAREMNFGVVDAVREFTRSNGWHLIAMTNDMFPNCLLARDPGNEKTTKLIGDLILNVPNIVKINDPWNYSHDHFNFDDNELRLVPTF